mgnify:CR=1 FL=1
MMTIIIVFLTIPVIIFIGMLLLRVRSKKLLIGIPTAVLCMPFVFGFLIYLARTPIQQGKFLPDFGPLLNLVFPPDDLYKALAEENLSPTKKIYIFNISHKYVGKHGISIIVPSPDGPDFKKKEPLKVSTRFFRGDKIILECNESGSWFWRNDAYGFEYSYYSVPSNLPVSEPLRVEVTIYGDIDAFLKQNKGARVAVKKMSDE